MKCKTCRFWDTEWEDTEEKPCVNPIINKNDKGGMIRYGGSDGDGDYFHPSGEFGCIFFEVKE